MESNKDQIEQITTFTDSVVFEIIKEFGERAKKGYDKYGTDMDRTDLTTSQWAQHLREELMDALVYLTRLKRDIELMEEKLSAMKQEVADTKTHSVKYHMVGTEVVSNEMPAEDKPKPSYLKYGWHY
jgi:hypothetical protein